MATGLGKIKKADILGYALYPSGACPCAELPVPASASKSGNVYNKRFENGPQDVVLIGGNGDPVHQPGPFNIIFKGLVFLECAGHKIRAFIHNF